eukprot:233080-Pyramimonas_sp.AAC.1
MQRTTEICRTREDLEEGFTKGTPLRNFRRPRALSQYPLGLSVWAKETEGAQEGPVEDLRVYQDVHVGPVEELQEARVQQGGIEHAQVGLVGVGHWGVLSRLHLDAFYSGEKRNAPATRPALVRSETR